MNAISIDTTLAERLNGTVITPADAGYDEARALWNGMIDKRPALIARCADAHDVAAAVTYARTHGLPLAIRGGGHNVAGTALVEGGLVVDLGDMRTVTVDPAERIARVEGGARWADVDAATQAHGLATPGGVVSETGVAGLTLNGGVSWHRRKHGMTIDNLVAAEVVLADGRLVRASATEHRDLLWALKGGGGNFGVVVAFEFALHELGPEVAFLYCPYPASDATTILRAYRELVANAPDELTVDFGIERFAADPELPAELHGVPYAGLFGMYAGPVEEGMAALQPFRELGTPIIDLTQPMPFGVVQSMLDPKFPDGERRYWKALYLDDITDEIAGVIVERGLAAPSAASLTFLRHLGGAMSRVPSGATAFGDRSAQFMLSIDATWEDSAEDEPNVAWTRAFWDELNQWAGDRTYFNFPGKLEEGEAALRASYGANYDRLRDVKTTYDPDNVFRSTQNIRPR